MMGHESVAALSVMNSSLAQMIEDTILFGKLEEIETLLDQVADHPDISDELRYGLEGLRYFRSHYTPSMQQMSPSTRQRVMQFDTDWSMQLLDMLHKGEMKEMAELSA
ncbi:MAG: hypothetical protein PHX43_04415 [Alphaproteobacteria bacterium]|nr:hypothetical protein [Alphaproteobacteria bacterium]